MADRLMQDIYRKIEREKQIINSARSMRQATDNPVMQQRVDTQIRESQRNLGYLEGRMSELQTRRMNQGMDNMNLNDGLYILEYSLEKASCLHHYRQLLSTWNEPSKSAICSGTKCWP